MTVAFFDLDRTLLSKNSGSLWVKQEFRAGRLSIRYAVKAAIWLTRYHMGQANIETALDQAVIQLKDQPEKNLETRSQQFYEEKVKHLYRPGALEAIEKHRSAGDTLVLLTTSSVYMSRSASDSLHFDDYLCNQFEVNTEGLFTGKLLRPVCYGEGKLKHAIRYLEGKKTTLKDCYFYTDSVSDLPVLEAVGNPRVVAPDRKLRIIARERDWPILEWGP